MVRLNGVIIYLRSLQFTEWVRFSLLRIALSLAILEVTQPLAGYPAGWPQARLAVQHLEGQLWLPAILVVAAAVAFL